jgi:hypothetical protein
VTYLGHEIKRVVEAADTHLLAMKGGKYVAEFLNHCIVIRSVVTCYSSKLKQHMVNTGDSEEKEE